jgi:nicotinate-nucleotide adenylyltransferase
MFRLGLFGGSFNPVQCGHLLVARAALEELALTRLFFLPASQSPFKPGQELAPARVRLRLLRLALAGQTQCELDEQEIRRGGISYTIDTVRDYVRRFPGAALFYLIGSDHVPTLPQWREAPALAQLAEFVVIPRPGGSVAALPAPFRGRALKGFPLGVSSSEVRRRLKAGLPVEGLVPPAVAEALGREPLYGQGC